MEKKLLTIFGASGLVGSSILREALDRGYHVNGTLRNVEDQDRIARLKKLQKRTRGNPGTQSEGGTDRGAHSGVQNASTGTDSLSRRAQLFGYYRNVPGQTSGIGGSSSDVTYFKNVFERMSLNNPPTSGAKKGNN